MKRWPIVLLNTICISSIGFASFAVQGTQAEEKKAEEVYKNIKEMKGMPAKEVGPAMHYISAALGTTCEACHVRTKEGEWQFDKDDKEMKGAAREMMAMMHKINADNFNGRLQVTCSTCHHGATNPPRTPPLPGLGKSSLMEVEVQMPREQGLPKADDVLAKYTTAIGGADGIDKLKSLSMKGTETSGSRTSDVEGYAAAPNKMLEITTTPNGTFMEGFDGKVGWVKQGDKVQELQGEQLAELLKGSDFYADFKLKDQFKTMTVRGKAKIGDKETLLVQAMANDGTRQRLYFDTTTGLLVRKYVGQQTVFGELPEAYDYLDYRDVAGVKMPFTIMHALPRATVVTKFSEIVGNADIPSAKFEKPAGK